MQAVAADLIVAAAFGWVAWSTLLPRQFKAWVRARLRRTRPKPPARPSPRR